MKILWIVNTVSPGAAKAIGICSTHAISWVEAMGAVLKNRHELAIVAPGTDGKLHKVQHQGITYCVLPRDCAKKDYWGGIIREFQPDIIHAYGTEKKHNLLLIENYRDAVPIVISLQGILTAYQKYYYAGIPMKDILMNYTIGDILLRRGILKGKRNFVRQSKYEQQMLRGVRYVEGRSDWDRAVSLDINPELKYYYCPRMIRSAFFDHAWGENYELHSILVHQADYPIKGLHVMLDALAKLSRKYPDVKLYVAGKNYSERKTLRKKLGKAGYVQYIERKIRKYGLQDRIVFTGMLDAEHMAEKLASVHVCVIPSAIENAPNALAEAMVVGTPCVASYAGGNAGMLNQGSCGLLYRFDEPEVLALRIETLFEQEALTRSLSENAYRTAHERHDPETLEKMLLTVYRDIADDFKRGGRAVDQK